MLDLFIAHTAITIISKTKAKPPAIAPTMTPTLMESDEGAFDSCGASGEGGGLLSGAEVVERRNGGEGGGEGGGGDGAVDTMVGTDSTVIPSNAEAAAAVPRLAESKSFTAAAVVPAGTKMVAVMITLAAVTRIVTSDSSTPAAVAMLLLSCKIKVSE